MPDLVNWYQSKITTVAGKGTTLFLASEFFAAKDGRGLINGRFRIDPSVDIFAMGLVYLYMFCYNTSEEQDQQLYMIFADETYVKRLLIAQSATPQSIYVNLTVSYGVVRDFSTVFQLENFVLSSLETFFFLLQKQRSLQ